VVDTSLENDHDTTFNTELLPVSKTDSLQQKANQRKAEMPVAKRQMPSASATSATIDTYTASDLSTGIVAVSTLTTASFTAMRTTTNSNLIDDTTTMTMAPTTTRTNVSFPAIVSCSIPCPSPSFSNLFQQPPLPISTTSTTTSKSPTIKPSPTIGNYVSSPDKIPPSTTISIRYVTVTPSETPIASNNTTSASSNTGNSEDTNSISMAYIYVIATVGITVLGIAVAVYIIRKGLLPTSNRFKRRKLGDIAITHDDAPKTNDEHHHLHQSRENAIESMSRTRQRESLVTPTPSKTETETDRLHHSLERSAPLPSQQPYIMVMGHSPFINSPSTISSPSTRTPSFQPSTIPYKSNLEPIHENELENEYPPNPFISPQSTLSWGRHKRRREPPPTGMAPSLSASIYPTVMQHGRQQYHHHHHRAVIPVAVTEVIRPGTLERPGVVLPPRAATPLISIPSFHEDGSKPLSRKRDSLCTYTHVNQQHLYNNRHQHQLQQQSSFIYGHPQLQYPLTSTSSMSVAGVAQAYPAIAQTWQAAWYQYHYGHLTEGNGGGGRGAGGDGGGISGERSS
jgi:hypothetical protein